MIKLLVAISLILAWCNTSLSSETRLVATERELAAIPYDLTGVLDGPRRHGWRTRTALYKGLGDRKCVVRDQFRRNSFRVNDLSGWVLNTIENRECNFDGDPSNYMQPFLSTENARLKEVQGVWICNQRGGDLYTAGVFKFGVNDKGGRYAVVNRSKQLEKGASDDFKKFIEAGKVVAVVLGIYRGDPEGGEQDAEDWENVMKDVDNYTNTSMRRDMTPTVINGRERWVAEGVFSITVRRYYNCTIDIRFKEK